MRKVLLLLFTIGLWGSLPAQNVMKEVRAAWNRGDYPVAKKILLAAIDGQEDARNKQVFEALLAQSCYCDSLREAAGELLNRGVQEEAVRAYSEILEMNSRDRYCREALRVLEVSRGAVPSKKELDDWLEIKRKDQKIAYEVYLYNNPRGTFVNEAVEVLEEKVWEEVKDEHSKFAYEDYLKRYPAGTHAAEVKALLDTIADMELWSIVYHTNTIEAYHEYLAMSQLQMYKSDAEYGICLLLDEQLWLKIADSRDSLSFQAYIESEDVCKQFVADASRAVLAIRQDEYFRIAERYYELGSYNRAVDALEKARDVAPFLPEQQEAALKYYEEVEYIKASRSRNKDKLDGFLKKYPESRYYASIEKRSEAVQPKSVSSGNGGSIFLGVGTEVANGGFTKIGIPKVELIMGGEDFGVGFLMGMQYATYVKSFYGEYGRRKDYRLSFNQIALHLGVKTYVVRYGSSSMFLSFTGVLPFNFGGKFFGASHDKWLNQSPVSGVFGVGVSVKQHEIRIYGQYDFEATVNKEEALNEHAKLKDIHINPNRISDLADKRWWWGVGYAYNFRLK